MSDLAVIEPSPVGERPERLTWVACASVGLGSIASSAENDVLAAEGYHGVRDWAALEGAWLAARWVGIGGWAAVSYRAATGQLEALPPLRG